MTVTLKRQLTESEKQEILKEHGRKCWATGHPIPDTDVIHFDHIHAFSEGGATELANIAPMCETHNKAKGTLALEDFRVKLRLGDFFSHGDAVTLKHLLAYLKKSHDIETYGQTVTVNSKDDVVTLEAGSKTYDFTLYACPTTGWKYFYATLPVGLLDSDDDEDQKVGLQPRFLISEKVFELYRHFQRHPVLQPSIGRISQNRVLLFDGQHKIAALLWTGRRNFECKIYLAPDLRLLNETNIAAHDKFSQTRFFASVMVLKLGAEFGADFERYKNLEDGSTKSEFGFMKFLDKDPSQSLTKADRNRRFRSYLYNSVIQHADNQATRFVSTGNRSTDEKPITLDMLSKSIFACFLYRLPVEDDMATDAYRRDDEITNNVAFMNMLHDLALASWNPGAGPNDGNQRRLDRLFRSKSILAWSELVRDAICGKLDLLDSEDRERPFYRRLTPDQLTALRKVIERLVNSKVWSAPANDDIDRVLADNKSQVKDWLKNHGLNAGYLMGAPDS
jgi:hypothetical protein